MLARPWIVRLGTVGATQLVGEGSVLLRNIIVAQFLGAATLGQFVALVLGLRLLAMSTDLATERYLMQVAGNRLVDTLMAANRLCQLRALVMVLLIVGTAYLWPRGIDGSSYMLLACSVLVRGFTHQGYRLAQRAMNFGPVFWVEGLAALFGTLAIMLVAFLSGSIAALCLCLLVQAVVHTYLSHRFADMPYESGASRQAITALVHYGWPLLLSGAAMFWSMQGERLVLAALLSAEAFAHFAMMFQLALVPILILSRIGLVLGLPFLAASKDRAPQFRLAFQRLSVVFYSCAALFVLGFMLCANPFLSLFFGVDFMASQSLLLMVAIAQGLRLCRAPHSIAAQALGYSDIPFIANAIRLLAVGAMFVAAHHSPAIETVLTLACIGETIAFAVQVSLFHHKTSGSYQPKAEYV